MCDRCYAKIRVAASKNKVSAHDQVSKVDQAGSTISTTTAPEQLNEPTQELSQNSSESQTLSPNICSSSTTASLENDSESSYVPSDANDQNLKEEYVTMPFDRVAATKACCFICRSNQDLMDVLLESRIQVFAKRLLFIPKRNRCCSEHLLRKRFLEGEIDKMEVYSNETEISKEELKVFLDKLSDKVDERFHDKIKDFSIFDERVKVLTGHYWEVFFHVKSRRNRKRSFTNSIK